MLDQILADPRQIHQRPDPDAFQPVGGPHSGEHEKLRRAVDARRHDDFAVGERRATAAAALVVDAERAPLLQADAAHQRPRLDLEIAPVHDGLEEHARRAAAPAAHHGHFAALEAFGLAAVIVIRRRIARSDAGGANLLIEHVRPGNGDFQFPRCTVIGIFPQPALFRFAEVRQNIGVTPAGEAQTRPIVIVAPVAPRIDHAVDHRRAAQSLAARNVDSPPVEMRLGFTFEVPIQVAPEHVLWECHGHVFEQPGRRTARLQEQNAHRRILSQSIRENTSRGPGPDDDVVVSLRRNARHGFSSPVPQTANGSIGCARCRRFRSAQSEPAFIRRSLGWQIPRIPAHRGAPCERIGTSAGRLLYTDGGPLDARL